MQVIGLFQRYLIPQTSVADAFPNEHESSGRGPECPNAFQYHDTLEPVSTTLMIHISHWNVLGLSIYIAIHRRILSSVHFLWPCHCFTSWYFLQLHSTSSESAADRHTTRFQYHLLVPWGGRRSQYQIDIPELHRSSYNTEAQIPNS